MVGAAQPESLLKHAAGRRAVISSEAVLGGWQIKHTPWPLVESMVDRAGVLHVEGTPVEDSPSVMVLFNLEFLEVLHARYGDEYMREKVSFIADSPIERLFAQRCYGVKALKPSRGAWHKVMDDKCRNKHRNIIGKLMAKLNAPADITFSNPPYNRGLDLKILLALFDLKLIKRLVCVHPSTWLVDVKTQLGAKTGNPTFRKFQQAVEPHLKSVYMFNGNHVFGIGLFVPCVVTDLDMGWTRQQGTAIKVTDVGQEEARDVFHLADITLHGKDWDPTVKEFMGRVQKLCARNGALVDHREPYVGKWPTLWHAVQLAPMVGNWTASSFLKMVKEDFYTFLQKDPEKSKRNDATDERFHTFGFASSAEQDNAVGFLQTDFARICLALLKTSQNSYQGDMAFVPWLDFTRSWNDDQLFSMLGYPRGHAIREYAKRFLPDYHNIYPNGKTY